MENFSQIIVISQSDQINLADCRVIRTTVSLKSDVCLITGSGEYFFDYLIFDDPRLIANLKQSAILTEGGIPVTNFFNQTSIENIFYKKEKLDELITNLRNNEF